MLLLSIARRLDYISVAFESDMCHGSCRAAGESTDSPEPTLRRAGNHDHRMKYTVLVSINLSNEGWLEHKRPDPETSGDSLHGLVVTDGIEPEH
ncbi:hypothetical protein J6590_033625 [Homalodisca vitripennis]|nr:hypothetical protein J6590_033625 [Homalodisca vitripennis]